MQISWTRVPFPARNREEFSHGLTSWLSQVFYETLPGQGYEVREEQIYTAFRMARAFTGGTVLFAEAGPGTGKTFAYLLTAVCYARFTGKPVVVASASGLLQAQLANPEGDIQTLSRILGLNVDARLASDPSDYLCKVKADRVYPSRAVRKVANWAKRTRTGARSEVPDSPDEVWAQVAWDPTLSCDTCRQRGICHMMQARRHYRAAGDLIVTDHRLFTWDLYTRADRQELGQMPLLPAYSAVVLDEGHHLPETWQRTQGHQISAKRLRVTLELIRGLAEQVRRNAGLAAARKAQREHLAQVLVPAALQESQRFLELVLATAAPGEGKRHVPLDGPVREAAESVVTALEAVQDELTTEEAMQEGTDDELTLRAYQGRLDEVIEGLALFQSPQAVPWVEGEDLWVVPRHPLALTGPGHLPAGIPVLFSSATLEPAYGARTLGLNRYDQSRVGVPFNLAAQVLVYQPERPQDEVAQVIELIRAVRGRTLVLLRSLAEVAMYKARLLEAGLPWRIFFEGETERGAMLEAFRDDVDSCMVGATFWEGVDVPGQSLSCVVIPQLPFPPHDPLIRERRAQAGAQGEDPFRAVDLPEMLLKLKQGMGRLIRTASDRGVIALLDREYLDQPWAEAVAEILPEGAEATSELERVAAVCR
ncbi:MAG TPA: ATP-dependent DNA helicase [Symbiobacteriaceae bacterium]|nr:ATP-dependent DNA helicase [Symbiobacteriaceae bacterium]